MLQVWFWISNLHVLHLFLQILDHLMMDPSWDFSHFPAMSQPPTVRTGELRSTLTVACLRLTLLRHKVDLLRPSLAQGTFSGNQLWAEQDAARGRLKMLPHPRYSSCEAETLECVEPGLLQLLGTDVPTRFLSGWKTKVYIKSCVWRR